MVHRHGRLPPNQQAHFPPLVPGDELATLEKARTAQLAGLDKRIADLQEEQTRLQPDWIAGGPDLGFETQSAGAPLGKPWVHSGPVEISKLSQSPFQHVHPAGKLGARVGSGKPTDGLRYVFSKGLKETQGKKMHFTVDFRTLAESPQKGAFRFYLGRGVVQSLAIECSATSSEFAIRNGQNWEVIRKLVPGQWYTLQITIDPGRRKYSGLVGKKGDLTRFEEKNTGPNWDGVADCFICDGFGHLPGAACGRDIDNIGLGESPFALPGSHTAIRKQATPEEDQRLKQLPNQIRQLTAERERITQTPGYPVAYGVSEGSPVDAPLQIRGEPSRPGNVIQRRNLEVLGAQSLDNRQGSGRLEMARWIAQAENPLTTRVWVNRIWKWHFGRGIVSTVSDFGYRGARPTHPQLLDWLAAEFLRQGGSTKSLHRLIMTSRTYQLASTADTTNQNVDPENRFLWRFPRRPLDAESTRDAMLAISGRLDRTVPAAHPFPPVHTWGFTIHHPFHAVYPSSHRSVYLMIQRNRRHPYLALFDAADPNQVVGSRTPTTTPTQALYLMNSPFLQEQALGFGQRISSRAGNDRQKISWAYETAHGRSPGEEEIQRTLLFLQQYRSVRRETDGDGSLPTDEWSALARVLLTSNAFLYVD